MIKKNHNIFVIDNLEKKKKLNKEKIDLISSNLIYFIKYDLTKPIKLKKNNFDIIFNLAAILGVKNVNKNPYQTLINNIEITKNLINFCKKQKNCKLINFSSSEIYSNLIFKKKIIYPTPEALDLFFLDKSIPRDSYGLSKFIGEKMCQLSKINFINIRPHNIYGPDMGYSHVVPELIKKILIKNKVSILSYKHKRAFCYIDDAIKQTLEISFAKKADKKTINIGNPDEEISIYKLANKIKYFLNRNTIILKDKHITEGSPARRVPSLSKYDSFFGKIKYTKLDEGLKRTIAWYLMDIKNFRKNN